MNGEVLGHRARFVFTIVVGVTTIALMGAGQRVRRLTFGLRRRFFTLPTDVLEEMSKHPVVASKVAGVRTTEKSVVIRWTDQTGRVAEPLRALTFHTFDTDAREFVVRELLALADGSGFTMENLLPEDEFPLAQYRSVADGRPLRPWDRGPDVLTITCSERHAGVELVSEARWRAPLMQRVLARLFR